jgi:hypothetical protein
LKLTPIVPNISHLGFTTVDPFRLIFPNFHPADNIFGSKSV